MSTKRRKRHTAEQIVRKLRDADAMLNTGKDLAAVRQALEVGQSTSVSRHTQHGGMKAEEAKRRELHGISRRRGVASAECAPAARVKFAGWRHATNWGSLRVARTTVPTRAEESRQILCESNALLRDDHFVYIDGNHGSGWIDKNAMFVNVQHLERLGHLLAEEFEGLDADVLCGPATGGLMVAQWTARASGHLAVFAEHAADHRRDELRGHFGLHRGYDRLVRGRRVIVVDDVVNSGLSIRQTAEAVRHAGGEVIAAAAFVDRGNVDAQGMGVPSFRYLLQELIPEWPAEQCPLCRTGVPVNTEFAHGQDFIDSRRP